MVRQAQNMSTRGLEIIKGGDFRGFYSEKAHPAYPYGFAGRMTINDIPLTRAANTKIKAPSDDMRNAFEIVDEIVGDFEDLTTSFTQKAHRYLNELWWELVEDGRVGGVLKLIISKDSNPQNMLRYDSQLALVNVSAQGVTLAGAKNPQQTDENEASTVTGDLNFWKLLRILRLKFAAIATSAVAREALDCDYRKGENGNVFFYVLLTNVAATTPSGIVVYNKTLGTVKNFNLAALSTDGKCERLAVVGDYLIALSVGLNAHYVSPLEDAEAGTDSFVEVDGYTASKTPSDLYALSTSDIIICAAGGYLYRLTGVNIAPTIIDAGVLTVQNQNRIHGNEAEVVSVGASNTVLYSSDDGQSFELQVGPAVGVALSAVCVHSLNTWFIGTATGKLYYTEDAGALGASSYTEIVLPETVDYIRDIKFSDPVCGVLVADKGTAAYVYRTTDSGRTWRRTEPDLKDQPASGQLNAVAVPLNNPNVVLAVGQGAGGSGGLAALATGLSSR